MNDRAFLLFDPQAPPDGARFAETVALALAAISARQSVLLHQVNTLLAQTNKVPLETVEAQCRELHREMISRDLDWWRNNFRKDSGE